MRSANHVILVLLVAVTALSPFLWHEIAAQQQRARSEPVVLAQAAPSTHADALAGRDAADAAARHDAVAGNGAAGHADDAAAGHAAAADSAADAAAGHDAGNDAAAPRNDARDDPLAQFVQPELLERDDLGGAGLVFIGSLQRAHGALAARLARTDDAEEDDVVREPTAPDIESGSSGSRSFYSRSSFASNASLAQTEEAVRDLFTR